jgi:hypothetical protein
MKLGVAIFLATASLLIALQGPGAAAQETPCGGEQTIKTVTGTITEIGHPRGGITVTIHATDGVTYMFGVESACVLGTTADRLKPGDKVRVSFFNLTQNYPPTYGNPVSIALLGRGGSAVPSPSGNGGAENRSPSTTTGGIPPNTIILDEFNGSTAGQAYGITYVPTPAGQGALFGRQADSRIEYPQGIPAQGTLEWWIKVDSGYWYQNFVLRRAQTRALIFTTDVSGGDVTWPGSAWLWVSANGDISFYLATRKYQSPPADAVIARGTKFRFGQWHSIGISYGSQGQAIEVDGQLVAAELGNTQWMGAGGNHFLPLDVPTIGESVSHFWRPHQYSGGFDGIVDRFRASAAQRDWVLSAVDLAARSSAGPATTSVCTNATDLGYSLSLNGETYRVQEIIDAGGKQIPIFLDPQGRPIRDVTLLNELELGAWTRENVIASSATRVELAQKDTLLPNLVGTLEAMNTYLAVQDLLARGMAVSLEAAVTGGTSLPAAVGQVSVGELEHQLQQSPRTMLVLMAEEGLTQSKTLYDQLNSLLYPSNATLLDVNHLERIYTLFMQAHTLELPNEALAAGLSPKYASELTQQALNSVMSQVLLNLQPINPSAGVTLQMLQAVQQGVADASETVPALSGYRTNLYLALNLAHAYKRQISTWAAESAAACGGTGTGSVPIIAGVNRAHQNLAGIDKKIVGIWWSGNRRSYIKFLATGACSVGYLYPDGKWHVQQDKWAALPGESFQCTTGMIVRLLGANKSVSQPGQSEEPPTYYYRGIQNIPKTPTTLSVAAAQRILDQQINMTTVNNTLLTCRACYDPNDKEDNDKAPIVSTVSGPLIPFLAQQDYIRANSEKDAPNRLVFTGKAKRSRYYGPDGFRFANFRNPRILVSKIVDPRHVPIEYEFVPTELTMGLFGRVYILKSLASFSYENEAWSVCIGCK